MMFFPFFGAPCCPNIIRWLTASSFEALPSLRIATSPLSANLLICVGNISHKQAPLIERLHNDMPKPSYILHVKGCARNLSPYASVETLDHILPIDVTLDDCLIEEQALKDVVANLGRTNG